MSTYQYYEFLSIDGPLAPDEQQAVAGLSSRAAPHPRRARRDCPGLERGG
jgi:hypothetical protein